MGFGRMLRTGLAAGLIGAGPAGAADPLEAGSGHVYDVPYGAPRYFPRGDGAEAGPVRAAAPPRRAGCTPRRAMVPTNAPDDPSYVGSAYGLSKPSYYGLTPPPGVDDPFGRSLLPYCR